MIEELWIEH